MTDPDVDEQQYADFDAWRSAQTSQRPVRILGELVPLPVDIPLWIILADSKQLQDVAQVRKMVAELFGEQELNRWVTGGMGLRELSTLITWTIATVQGESLTFEQAQTRMAELMHNPPENRAARRKKGKKGKSNT